MENWKNFNKVFLYGYIWFGFCGAAAALGVFRFGNLFPFGHIVHKMESHDILSPWFDPVTPV